MKESEIKELVKSQMAYFESGATYSLDSRREALIKIRTWINDNIQLINDALYKDLGKGEAESYVCEVGLVLDEITFMLKHMKGFAKERSVPTPIVHFASHCYVKPVPYGNVLIMSPWNYPFILTMDPLVDALAAGNTCIIKPSAYSPETSKVIEKLVSDCFKEKYVAVVTGGRSENQSLLDMKFDYILFTGSQNVGREVLRKASEHLTPVTLELGGKSPVVVDETADIGLAAKRIVFGKYLNCGQTCVAPDYVLCHESIKDKLVAALEKEITLQCGTNAVTNPEYGKIVNEKHFTRLKGLIDSSKEKVIFGGEMSSVQNKIAPTLMLDVTRDDAVMKEEIFGPILPIMTYSSLLTVISDLEALDHPLAAYIFSTSKSNIAFFTSRLRFGGGCINDTLVHLATPQMGFGGVGESGMGQYHGKTGFELFSHNKSILDKKNFIDISLRYKPYKKSALRLFKMILK